VISLRADTRQLIEDGRGASIASMWAKKKKNVGDPGDAANSADEIHGNCSSSDPACVGGRRSCRCSPWEVRGLPLGSLDTREKEKGEQGTDGCSLTHSRGGKRDLSRSRRTEIASAIVEKYPTTPEHTKPVEGRPHAWTQESLKSRPSLE